MWRPLSLGLLSGILALHIYGLRVSHYYQESPCEIPHPQGRKFRQLQHTDFRPLTFRRSLAPCGRHVSASKRRAQALDYAKFRENWFY